MVEAGIDARFVFHYPDLVFAFNQYSWNQNSLTSQEVSNDGMSGLTGKCDWKSLTWNA